MPFDTHLSGTIKIPNDKTKAKITPNDNKMILYSGSPSEIIISNNPVARIRLSNGIWNIYTASVFAPIFEINGILIFGIKQKTAIHNVSEIA